MRSEIDTRGALRLLREIAEGGMGKVYLAETFGAGGFVKTVAVKTIRQDLLGNPHVERQFIGEANLVADLIHENILQVYTLGRTDEGEYYLVMEFIKGPTLKEYLLEHQRQGRPLPHDFGVFIVSRICRGLDYAHNKRDRGGRPLSLVHRDVTPSNIMMDYRGLVKLADFGIAKGIAMSRLDETRMLLGKLPYLAPEQASLTATDRRTDLYTLGVVLYEVLTGRRPYHVRSLDELREFFRTGKIHGPQLEDPKVPDRLQEIVLKAVNLDPAKRYPTAFDLLQDLEHYLYDRGYGPTYEKLARYLREVFPGAATDIL